MENSAIFTYINSQLNSNKMTHNFSNGTNPEYLTGKCITVYLETPERYFFANNRFIALEIAKEGIVSGKYLATSETSVKIKSK